MPVCTPSREVCPDCQSPFSYCPICGGYRKHVGRYSIDDFVEEAGQALQRVLTNPLDLKPYVRKRQIQLHTDIAIHLNKIQLRYLKGSVENDSDWVKNHERLLRSIYRLNIRHKICSPECSWAIQPKPGVPLHIGGGLHMLVINGPEDLDHITKVNPGMAELIKQVKIKMAEVGLKKIAKSKANQKGPIINVPSPLGPWARN